MSNGPIQTIPTGLLSALGLKNRGRNPPDLGEVVHPHLDLFPWYANFELVNAGDYGTAPAGGGFVAFGAVVDGDRSQWKFVRNFTCQIIGMTGYVLNNECHFQPAYILNTLGKYYCGPESGVYISDAAGNKQAPFVSWENFWVPPDALLGCLVYRSDGAFQANCSGNVQRWSFRS